MYLLLTTKTNFKKLDIFICLVNLFIARQERENVLNLTSLSLSLSLFLSFSLSLSRSLFLALPVRLSVSRSMAEIKSTNLQVQDVTVWRDNDLAPLCRLFCSKYATLCPCITLLILGRAIHQIIVLFYLSIVLLLVKRVEK
jgi:type III secretory pathway component EscR